MRHCTSIKTVLQYRWPNQGHHIKADWLLWFFRSKCKCTYIHYTVVILLFSTAKDLGLGQSDPPFVRHRGKDLHNYHIHARQRIDVKPWCNKPKFSVLCHETNHHSAKLIQWGLLAYQYNPLVLLCERTQHAVLTLLEGNTVYQNKSKRH